MQHDKQLAECLEWKKHVEEVMRKGNECMTKAPETYTSLSNLWKVFYSACGFFVLVTGVLINNVIANDNKARTYSDKAYQELADAKLVAQKEHQEMMKGWRDTMDELRYRLGRIEGAVGIKHQ
jgi:hypothetical protein